MVTKSFGIFNGDNDTIVEDGDSLIIEIGKSHIALLLISRESNDITGFELFSFTENEEVPDKLFSAIENTSNLLKHTFATVNVFMNHEVCMPVPTAKFSKSVAEDYMAVIFGEAQQASTHTDHDAAHSEIVNLYRVPQEVMDALHRRFPNVILHHTWSNVLKMMRAKDLLSSKHLMHIQFYNTYFILVVIKDSMLQLIQVFIYENPDDVLYQMLNVAAQFNLSTEDVDLRISGLIDPNYKLFRELTNYFINIVADKADLSKVSVDVSEYPRHYFTPFFNLAL